MSAKPRVRELLAKQRAGTLELLARFHPLARDVLADPAWNRQLLHRNSRLDWGAIVEAANPPFAVDFGLLSKLDGWDADELERWRDRWDWVALSSNPGLAWSPSMIARFADRWDWLALSGNRGLPFDHALVQRHADRWVVSRLAANTAVPWDAALVDRLAPALAAEDPDWHPSLADERPIAVAPGITLMATGWEHLQQNPAIGPDVLDRLPTPDWALLSGNPGLPWSEAFMRRHAGELADFGLAKNPAVPWTAARIEQLLDAGRSFELSANPGIPWTEALIRRFADRWAWHVLSGNPSVGWTDALLREFGDRPRFDWNSLSANGTLTFELLERYADRLDWNWGVSCNHSIDLTRDLLAAHADRFHWERLSWHPQLAWGDALLLEFADRWVVRSFGRNEAAWAAIARNIDDAWIRALLLG